MRKFVSLLASFSILFNSLLTPLTVIAQEITPTPEPTPVATEEPTTEPTVEPTPEETLIPTPDPTIDPTATPVATVEPTTEVTPTTEATTVTTSEPEVQGATNENAESQAPPMITTDKEDYHPGETAVITGAFFEAVSNFVLNIFGGSEADGNYREDSFNITTDTFGGFVFNYVLDNVFRPLYTVNVINSLGNLVTETTFTDSAVQTYSNAACMQKVAGAPSGLVCTANDVSIANVNNIIILDDGCKFPGDTVTFTATWDIQSTSTERYDIGLYFATAGQSSALNGSNSCSVSTLANSPTPPWSNLDGDACGDVTSSAQVHPVITMTAVCNPDPTTNLLKLPYCTSWDNNAGGVCSNPSNAFPSTKSKCNCKDGFTVDIEVPPSSIEVVKSLSPSTDSGLFNLQVNGVTEGTGANVGNNGTTGNVGVTAGSNTVGETAGTNTSLTGYTSTVSCKDKLNNNTVTTSGTNPWTLTTAVGQNILCTITNTVNNGTLTVQKTTIPVADPTQFSIDVSGSGTITGSSVGVISDATDKVYTVTAGTYSVTETVPTGWSKTGDTCQNVVVAAGQTSTCLITNSRLPKLTVTKVVTNDNGGTKQVSDFPLFVNGNSVTSGVTNIYSTGSYVVSETEDSGYTSVISGDCDLQGNVSLAYGDNKACIITNNDKAGHLIINKVTIPNNTEETFSVTPTGLHPRLVSTGSPVDYTVDAGTYSVVESAKTGWEETGNTCDDIIVANGETEECTITNTQKGNIIVKKETTPDSETQSFEFVTNYNANFNLSDGQQNDSGFLSPSTYSVSENVPSGWTLSSATCDDGSTVNSINLSAGETVTCTFNNTKLGKIIVEKQTLPNGLTDSFEFTPTYNSGNKFNLADGQTNDSGYLLPGIYGVSETAKNGWDLDSAVCDDGSSASDIDLAAGETVTCVFTNSQRGSISGAKLEDNDGSLVTTGDQSNILNWTIELYSCASDFTGCVLSATDTTDGSGYSFINLVSGYYQVVEVLQSGWTNLTSLFTNVTLDPGEVSTNNNFVNFEKATIVVHKDVLNPDSGQTTDNTSFKVKLDGSNEKAVSENTTVTYNDLLPGTYTVSESFIPEGYEFVSLTNDGEVTVQSGETHHVYVVNKQKVAKLTVIKDVVNDNGGTKVAGNFTMNVTGVNPSNTSFSGSEAGTFVNLYAGGYSADETPVAGYAKSLSEDCSGTVNWGEEKTCTITNNDQSGQIKIVKNTVGGNETFNFTVNGPTTLTPSVTTVSNTGDTGFLSVNAGNYSVSEDVLGGWDLTNFSCDSGTAAGFTVVNGGSVTCTFTNTQKGHLIVQKTTVPANELQVFGITATGSGTITNGGAGTLTDSQDKNYEVTPGTYSVSENTPGNWVLTSNNCEDVEVSAGETEYCQIVNTKRGNVTVTKYHDHNKNGVQNQGDEVLSGWEIWLGQAAQWTGISGQVTFSDVEAGVYTLSEQINGGWFQSNISCSDDNEIDNNNSYDVTVNPGETTQCFIGNYQKGSILGQKFYDLNGNGVKNIGEVGLSGWTINLDIDANGSVDVTDITDQDGNYGFVNLNPGTYRIREENQDGWTQTSVNPNDVVLTSGQDTKDVDFGNRPNGTIHGYKWNDLNGDGQQDELNNFLSGWTINLYRVYGEGTSFVDSFVTDDGSHYGWYWFEHLEPGNYKVCEELQPGWAQTYPVANDGCHLVSLPDDSSGRFPEIFNAVNGPAYNFGNLEQIFEVNIEKSNDKNNTTAGEVVNYTLLLTNSGNVVLNNVIAIDNIPGQFSYVLGTSVVDGFPTSDPTITGNTLKWNIGSLSAGQSVEITYQVKIADNASNGTYTNLATCTANIGGFSTRINELFDREIDSESIECNIADSTVTIGTGQGYGGNLAGQVLGASTELPATGNPSWLLAFAALGLSGGLYLKKKYAKN